MSKNDQNLNLILNLLKELAYALEMSGNTDNKPNPKKVRTLISTARNVADNFDIAVKSVETDLELNFANLMEGGTFSMDLSFDRSKFYLEFADDWTGHIKKIFAAETFAGVIKAASDKKDEADLIYQMSKEQVVLKEETADEVAEEFEEKIPEDDELIEHSEEILREEIQEDDIIGGSNEELVRKIMQDKTSAGIKINTIIPDTEESLKGNLEAHRDRNKALEGKEGEGLLKLTKDSPLRQDAPEPSNLFPEKEATRNNFFGPSKKDELPGQKTFPVDPKSFTRN